MTPILLRLLILCWLLCAALPASAGELTIGNGYRVRFDTVSTRFLDADDARMLDIMRSRNHGLVTVNVSRNGGEGILCTPMADISGTITSPGIQPQPLEFRVVRSTRGVYQLAEFDFTEDARTHIELHVSPAPGMPAYRIAFDQHFHNH